MSTHPKLIVTHILVADDDLEIYVQKHHRVELLHLITLGIYFADRVTVGDDMAKVDLPIVEMCFWRHDAYPPGRFLLTGGYPMVSPVTATIPCAACGLAFS